MSYNLNEFSEKPDSALHEINTDAPGDTNAGKPPVDFFNSAGNTKLEDEDEDGKKKEETTEPNSDRPKGRVKLGKVISGKTSVTMINIFIPSFLVFAFSRFGYRTEKSVWKLNPEERETLNPVVQDCLDYIEIDFSNPFYALAFVSIMIYGSKAFDAIPELRKMKNDTIEDAVEEFNPDTDRMKQPVKEEKPKPQARSQYIETRRQIESTSLRKEKLRLTIQALAEGSPKDLIEAWKIYSGIFPEREEGYFRKWYANNIELMPDVLRFDNNSDGVIL